MPTTAHFATRADIPTRCRVMFRKGAFRTGAKSIGKLKSRYRTGNCTAGFFGKKVSCVDIDAEFVHSCHTLSELRSVLAERKRKQRQERWDDSYLVIFLFVAVMQDIPKHPFVSIAVEK